MQDKYLHNSSGYSKFKGSKEKRKKILYRTQQNRKSILGLDPIYTYWTSNCGTGIVFIGNMLSWLGFHNFVL